MLVYAFSDDCGLVCFLVTCSDRCLETGDDLSYKSQRALCCWYQQLGREVLRGSSDACTPPYQGQNVSREVWQPEALERVADLEAGGDAEETAERAADLEADVEVEGDAFERTDETAERVTDTDDGNNGGEAVKRSGDIKVGVAATIDAAREVVEIGGTEAAAELATGAACDLEELAVQSWRMPG